VIIKKTYSQNFAISLKGHDKGTVYAVMNEDNRFVYLSDGRLRKVSNPKKKNKKHIKCFEANKLSEYILIDSPITDGRLRRAIRTFKESFNNVSFESREEE